jgi:hypothetical protein
MAGRHVTRQYVSRYALFGMLVNILPCDTTRRHARIGSLDHRTMCSELSGLFVETLSGKKPVFSWAAAPKTPTASLTTRDGTVCHAAMSSVLPVLGRLVQHCRVTLRDGVHALAPQTPRRRNCMSHSNVVRAARVRQAGATLPCDTTRRRECRALAIGLQSRGVVSPLRFALALALARLLCIVIVRRVAWWRPRLLHTITTQEAIL